MSLDRHAEHRDVLGLLVLTSQVVTNSQRRREPMKILIGKSQGTIYPETNGYTGVDRPRVRRPRQPHPDQKQGQDQGDVKERLIQAVDDLDAGIKTSDGYTVGEAARDWLERGPGTSTRTPSRRTGSSSTSTSCPQIGAHQAQETQREPGRRLARRTHRGARHGQPCISSTAS